MRPTEKEGASSDAGIVQPDHLSTAVACLTRLNKSGRSRKRDHCHHPRPDGGFSSRIVSDAGTPKPISPSIVTHYGATQDLAAGTCRLLAITRSTRLDLLGGFTSRSRTPSYGMKLGADWRRRNGGTHLWKGWPSLYDDTRSTVQLLRRILAGALCHRFRHSHRAFSLAITRKGSLGSQEIVRGRR
jgi:hypothetical protein